MYLTKTIRLVQNSYLQFQLIDLIHCGNVYIII